MLEANPLTPPSHHSPAPMPPSPCPVSPQDSLWCLATEVKEQCHWSHLLTLLSMPASKASAQIRTMPEELVEGMERILWDVLGAPERKEDFLATQRVLSSHQDLSSLEDLMGMPMRLVRILTAAKTGIQVFLHQSLQMPQQNMAEVFLLKRCKNLTCQTPLPARGCTCKTCSTPEAGGFCSACMCVVCKKFDFETNTCRWIGCDFCLHWCHMDCALGSASITTVQPLDLNTSSPCGDAVEEQMEQMKPDSPRASLSCPACGHCSDLAGFVKDVFEKCSRDWDAPRARAELRCVGLMFQCSSDSRGAALGSWANNLLLRMDQGLSHQLACSHFLSFFEEQQSTGATTKSLNSFPTKTPFLSQCTTPSRTVCQAMSARTRALPPMAPDAEATVPVKVHTEGSLWGSKSCALGDGVQGTYQSNIAGAIEEPVIMQEDQDRASMNLNLVLGTEKKKHANISMEEEQTWHSRESGASSSSPPHGAVQLAGTSFRAEAFQWQESDRSGRTARHRPSDSGKTCFGGVPVDTSQEAPHHVSEGIALRAAPSAGLVSEVSRPEGTGTQSQGLGEAERHLIELLKAAEAREEDARHLENEAQRAREDAQVLRRIIENKRKEYSSVQERAVPGAKRAHHGLP